MPKIDLKLIAAATLLLGLFAGFYIDNTILTKPRIQILTDTINNQSRTITTLETQLNTLEGEHTTLQALYDQLDAHNVPLNQYTQLQQQLEEKETEIESLQSQIDTLSNTIITKDSAINSLENDLSTLQSEYNNLQDRYDAVYNPISITYTVNNLIITLTTTTDSYPENTAISGNVNIKYTNGTPFQGTYKLSMYKVYINSGSPSGVYTLNGASIYTWNNPFVAGAGSYKLSLSELKDGSGTEVVSSSVLRSHVIYLFEG